MMLEIKDRSAVRCEGQRSSRSLGLAPFLPQELGARIAVLIA